LTTGSTSKIKFIFDQGTDRLLVGEEIGTEAMAGSIELLALAIRQRLSDVDPAELSYSAQPWRIL